MEGGSRNPHRDVAASCDGVTQAAQHNTPLSSALCRPVQLYGPASRTSCFSFAFFPQTSSPLPPSLFSLLPWTHLSLWPDYFSLFLYFFRPANLPLRVCVTVAARSCSGTSTWSPPPLEPLKFAKEKQGGGKTVICSRV